MIKLYLALLIASFSITNLAASPAPDINFKTLRNTQVQLKELRGKVILVTFWASNCPSCITEIEDFKSLYEDYHKQGLELFAVSMAYDRPNYVVAAAKNHQIPYNVVLDLRGNIAKAFGQIQLVPTTLLIDSSGEVIYQTTGVFDLQMMQSRIELLLNTKKG